MTGRPSLYTNDIAKRICDELAMGKSLVEICEADDMPNRTTVYDWLNAEGNERFADSYARAREAQADFMADDIVRIADTEVDPAKARNRIDARKWKASKMHPRNYGDRIEHTGEGGGPLKVELVRYADDPSSK